MAAHTTNLDNKKSLPEKKDKEQKQLRQLAFWEQDNLHTAPNIVSRSPLFSPLTQGVDRNRKMLDSGDIFTAWGVRMSISGKQLDAADKDVFMELVRIGKANASDYVAFSRRKLLLSIGKSASGGDYKWLEESLRRLTETTFTYFPDKYSDTSAMKINLIQSVGWQDDQMFVRVGEEMKVLFAKNQYAYINMSTRTNLKSQLAKWLYDFIRANESGFKVFKVKTIQQTCGREGSRPNVFRKSLSKAIKELEEKDQMFEYPAIYQDTDSQKTWKLRYTKKRGSSPRVPGDLM